MACIGFTAILQANTGASQAFETISEFTQITLPALNAEAVESSHLGLTTPDRTYIPGWRDAGELAFEANYTKTWYNKLYAIRGKLNYTTDVPPSGPAVQFKVTMPDEDAGGVGTAQVFTFNGILTSLETTVDMDAVIKMKGKVKISGAITIA